MALPSYNEADGRDNFDHDVKLEQVDSKHGAVGVSIHDPYDAGEIDQAEQLVHDHDEFTPQEYKKLMLKVDLILMPMLMISGFSRPAANSRPQSTACSTATRRRCRLASSSVCARRPASSATSSAICRRSSTCLTPSHSTRWLGCCSGCPWDVVLLCALSSGV